jgi:hypothetical protein
MALWPNRPHAASPLPSGIWLDRSSLFLLATRQQAGRDVDRIGETPESAKNDTVAAL